MVKHRAIVRELGAPAAPVIVVALIAPLTASALGHHFADSQPDYMHLGASHSHDHSHAFEASRYLAPFPSPAPDGGLFVALYKSAEGVAAMLAAAPVDVEASSVLRFQPTSAFVMPLSPTRAEASTHTDAVGQTLTYFL